MILAFNDHKSKDLLLKNCKKENKRLREMEEHKFDGYLTGIAISCLLIPLMIAAVT